MLFSLIQPKSNISSIKCEVSLEYDFLLGINGLRRTSTNCEIRFMGPSFTEANSPPGIHFRHLWIFGNKIKQPFSVVYVSKICRRPEHLSIFLHHFIVFKAKFSYNQHPNSLLQYRYSNTAKNKMTTGQKDFFSQFALQFCSSSV